jgi:hypothetical protein
MTGLMTTKVWSLQLARQSNPRWLAVSLLMKADRAGSRLSSMRARRSTSIGVLPAQPSTEYRLIHTTIYLA